ncbi:MAG TPA: hypothetical protein VN875_06770 [Candidatus Binatus sp.]|nr:hypothetical protein [Candidatus Binatus sp.]
MNRRTLWIVLLSVCALAVAGCGNGGHLTVTITTAPTTLAAGTNSNVVATVTHDPAAAGVTWSCTPGNSAATCGSFNPAQTPSGTASVYTAPPGPPSSTNGVVTITATSVTNTARSASAPITITGVATLNFVFAASGEENNGNGDIYSIAGVVAVAQDGSGDIISGEQDFNDGDTNTVPDDAITGGSLVMASDGSGNATLTITTASGLEGVDGTETFALAFANTNHALIVQFDGTATSSGTYDLQTSTTAPASASFSFVAAGQTGGVIADEGGVFALDASGNITGTFDTNIGASPVLGTAIPTSAIGATDSFGRGSVTGIAGANADIAYYVVGAEVLRIIDIDTTATAVGSAYGQGSTPSTSLGSSVFSISNPVIPFAAVGQFTTSEGAFTGVADLNDVNTTDVLLASPIGGTFSIAANGYGSLSFGESDFGDVVETWGVYAVDPTLNILDPNNTTDTVDVGGALIAEMDTSLVGVGTIVPQTGTAQTSFAGFYAFGGQGETTVSFDEFDFVGTGTVTAGATTNTLVGEGSLSDPFGELTDPGVLSSDATFNATATPDPDNAGRYTLGPLAVAPATGDTDFTAFNFATVTAYQASGGQLFWLEVDPDSYFVGSLEQGTAPAGGARKAQAKSNLKKH